MKKPVSKKYSLNKEDAKSILINTLIYLGPLAIGYLMNVVDSIDFGKYAYLAPLISVALKTAQKMLAGK